MNVAKIAHNSKITIL